MRGAVTRVAGTNNYSELDRAALASAAVYLHPAAGDSLADLPGFSVDRSFVDPTTGFSASGFVETASRRLHFAVCGSNELLDFAAGANLALCQYEANRDQLLVYLADPRWLDVVLSGHSLGGGLCQYLGYDLVLRHRHMLGRLHIVTFNSIGGIYGLWRMHEVIDDTLVSAMRITHFAHPDDLVARIGEQLGGKLHLVTDDRAQLHPLLVCHAIDRFLPKEGHSVLEDVIEHPDRPFKLLDTANAVGPALRTVLLNYLQRRYFSATVRLLAIWRNIPRDERMQVLRLVASMTPLRRLVRHGLRAMFRIHAWLNNLTGKSGY